MGAVQLRLFLNLQTSRFSAIFSHGKLIVIFYSQDKSSYIPAYFPRYPRRAVRLLRGKFLSFLIGYFIVGVGN